MNSEERKNYNKTYYAINKAKILKIACEKVECEFCKRTVIKNNIQKHKASKLCKNTEKQLIDDLKRKNAIKEIVPNVDEVVEVEKFETLEPVESNVKNLIKKFENKNI